MDIKINNLHKYTMVQKYFQRTGSFYVGFIVSGVEYMKISLPDRTDYFNAADNTLLLLPPGSCIDFEFNEKRCNFFASIECDELIYDKKLMKNLLRCGEEYLEMAAAVKLSAVQSSFFYELFVRAEKLANSAIPAYEKAAGLLLTGVFSEFAAHTQIADAVVPPEIVQLKKLIDADTGFCSDLNDIMSQIRYSAGHLRRLFRAHYSLSIAEYRAKVRFARICQLMLDNNLSMKEIADMAGMKNVTHLHKFVRSCCGMTPKELRSSLGR